MKLNLYEELYRIKSLINEQSTQKTTEDSDKEDCLKKRIELKLNTFWSTVNKKCTECPEGQALLYPQQTCGVCTERKEDEDEYFFITQFGCEKVCDYMGYKYFNRETGNCEDIPLGKWYDGETIQDFDTNPDIIEYWNIDNQKRAKKGLKPLDPMVKPTDENDLNEWKKIYNYIRSYIQDDIIDSKKAFKSFGSVGTPNSLKDFNTRRKDWNQNCKPGQNCQPPII